MSDSIDKTRTRLEARLASLQGRLTEINETLREPQDDDFEEQAADLDDDDVLEHLSHAGKIEAYLIEAALARMDEGTYGKCIDCGKAIPKARLQALPEAERCMPCAEQCSHR